MEASAEEGKCAIACYIDLLPRDGSAMAQSPTDHRCVPVALRASQRGATCRCCRDHLNVKPDTLRRSSMGITVYLTACGATLESATGVLASALRDFAAAVVADEHSAGGVQKLQ